jgi:hypothetical protein
MLMKMSSYAEIKQLFIDGLSEDASAQEAGSFKDVGTSFDEVDGLLPRDQGAEFDKLFIALHFWDGWIDARNHDWRYYKGIEKSDWPILAKGIVAALSEDQEISEPIVLEHFDLKHRQPSKGPLRRFLDFMRA